MGRSFIDRADPTFDDLGRREVINVRCKCGREVQIAPYQLIGQHGVQKHTKVWSLRDRFRWATASGAGVLIPGVFQSGAPTIELA